MKVVALLVAFSFSVFAVPAFAQSISPSDAPNHYNKRVTVKGVVMEVHTSGRGNTFLDFGDRYPKQIFTGYIPAANAPNFPNVNSLEGKEVCIDGVVVPYDGKPEIKLEQPPQLHPCH